MDVQQWTVTQRLDGAGEWSATFSSTDPQTKELLSQRYVSVHALLPFADGFRRMGGGPIDRIDKPLPQMGQPNAWTIGGSDTLRDLFWHIETRDLQDSLERIVEVIMPSDWAYTVDRPPFDELNITYELDSVLNALVQLSKKAQTHFYLSGRRAVAFSHIWQDVDAIAVDVLGDFAEIQIPIRTVNILEESFDFVSRIIPLGSGNSGAALTLAASTKAQANGYAINRSGNYIDSDYYANNYADRLPARPRVMQFKEITALSGTPADVQSAANQLQAEAEYWLSLHDRPTEVYSVSLGSTPVFLRPLQRLRIVHSNEETGLQIDDWLYITETKWTGNPSGLITCDVTVSNKPIAFESQADHVAGAIVQAEVYQIHRQRNANIATFQYQVPLDNEETAEMRLRFDDDVLQVSRVVMDCSIGRLTAPVKAIDPSGTTDLAPAAGSPPSDTEGPDPSGGGSNHTHGVHSAYASIWHRIEIGVWHL